MKSSLNSKRSTSNRKNAGLSTGPKTTRGKLSSRLNATKHGFFSQELPIPEADRPIFDKIRENLRIDLKPSSTAQEIAFDNIMDCLKRRILALRFEGKKIAAQLTDKHQSPREDEKAIDPHNLHYFLSSRPELHNAIKFLFALERDLHSRGHLTEEEKEILARVFGPGFVDVLERWTPPMSWDAILGAEQQAAHRRNFGDFPQDNAATAGGTREVEKTELKVVLDPMQAVEMRLKLLSQRREFLQDLLRFTQQSWAQDSSLSSIDFNPRFFATATRDLQRAFAWFFELKAKGI